MTATRDSRQERVAIAWHGLPLYAASAIAAAVKDAGGPVDVIATKPAVPAAGMEARIGLPVHWIDDAAFPSFGGLGLAVPRVLFVTGWAVPAFMRLVQEAKRSGTKVVAMVDNSFRGDLRQFAGAIAYRALYRRLFDHVWVPGRSASRLMRFYGVPGHRISTGLYTADTSVFTHRTPIETRPMRFVYAGQLVGRKNVVAMCEAFLEFRRTIAGPCDLHVFGSGPLRDRIPNHPDIRVHPFVPPDALADVFNDARCLVLPSTIDHWGVVVHEAAACGTLLITSDSTGAAADLCGPDNSRLVRASDKGDLIEAFRWAATLSPTHMAAGSRQSQELAAAFSPDRWAATFHEMCSGLLAEGSSA